MPHLFCVLCENKNAGNMGAVARAVKNMGLDGLLLVDPNRERWLDAIKMASGAEEVLERAVIYPAVDQALVDMHLVVGTTARPRRYRPSTVTPRKIMEEIACLPEDHRVALLFGSERSGLSNHDLSFCQRVVEIPACPEFSSLNLAQAVMIMAYEWHLIKQEPPPAMQERLAPLAESAERQGLVEHCKRVLMGINFITGPSDHIMLTLIDMLSRIDMTRREVAILRGVLQGIEYSLGSRPERFCEKRDE